MGGADEARCVSPASRAQTGSQRAVFLSANQFRALEEDEIMFLDSVREKQAAEERERKMKDGEEVKNFKEYVYGCPLTSTLTVLNNTQSCRSAHERCQ
jgi:hypothetical protein